MGPKESIAKSCCTQNSIKKTYDSVKAVEGSESLRRNFKTIIHVYYNKVNEFTETHRRLQYFVCKLFSYSL